MPIVHRTTHTFNFWLVFRKAKDLPDQWIAHCLELDLVTQGNSLPHALEMIEEAIWITMADDLAKGHDPLSRRAPKKFWDALWPIVRKGKRVDFKSVLKEAANDPGPFVVTVEMEVLLEQRRAGTAKGCSPRRPFKPKVQFAVTGA